MAACEIMFLRNNLVANLQDPNKHFSFSASPVHNHTKLFGIVIYYVAQSPRLVESGIQFYSTPTFQVRLRAFLGSLYYTNIKLGCKCWLEPTVLVIGVMPQKGLCNWFEASAFKTIPVTALHSSYLLGSVLIVWFS
jgi:hypothetical protein